MLGLDYSTLELYSAIGPQHDLARFGSEVMRPSPRQTDVLIVSGAVTRKMAPVIAGLHEAMAEPRFVIALGHGAVSGAPWQGSYNVLPGIEGLVPVDVWLPGDPPRPEAIIDAILALRARILAGANAVPATMPRYKPQRWPYLHEAMAMGDTEE
jgi:NADH-quinone oxidoreductase subunit B